MSQKFKEYKGLDLTKVANDTLAFWEENDIFKKSITTRDSNKPFVFYEGPPSANGLPGIHHVMARAIKDIFCRYKTLKGYQVKRKAGWDTHGLPIELGVEKELGITKEDIGKKISVEAYNEACKKAVMRYTDVWEDLTLKMGHWVDMDNPYITYKPKYMETVWWLLAQLYKKGLIYKGYTIQPYSPKAGTGLSSHELNQPGTYRDVTDTTVVAQFKVQAPTLSEGKGAQEGSPSLGEGFRMGDLGEDVYFIAWTTTPWTLPSNTALAVGKKIDYVLVETFNQYTYKPIKVILARDLLKNQFKGKFYESNDIFDFWNSPEKTDRENVTEILKSVFNKDQVDKTIDFMDFTDSLHKKIPYRILGTCKGADLIGIKYEQLLPFTLPYQDADKAFRVIAGDFVTTEDGTGIVHIAPTFGQDDAQVAKEAGVPPMLVLDDNGNPVPLVDLQGRFIKQMGKYAGKYVKNEYYTDGEVPERSLDVELAIQLKEENKAFNVEKHKHSYPHCWRTDKPILYYPLDSWFIKVTEKRNRMFALNETIKWKPKSTGEGRFGNWLKNANDWNLSRSRYWGTPLPIWRTEEGDETKMIGSVAELKEEMAKAVKAGFMEADIFPDFEVGNMSEVNYDTVDLHKNIVDKIVLVSDKGKPMYREADLIDVWFDSGSMPYAQWHYPFEIPSLTLPEGKGIPTNFSPKGRTKEGLRIPFPADFIAEGVDQTRGWFYTLHAIGTMVFDSVAYKNVVSNGLVLDKFGKKMSKRLGNAANPFETMKKYGADPVRWYMISNANPWDNLKFDVAGIEEVRRKFFGTLYNTYAFFTLYANLDNFKYAEAEINLIDRPEIDRWILSELHTLIKNVEAFYEDYEPTKAARAIQYFVTENLSNWFVRLSRRRYWKGDYKQDKISAYQTLHTCLVTVAKLASPIAPFFTDQLYRDLMAPLASNKSESVHLSHFPVYDLAVVDANLERKMQKAQVISSMVLSLRKKEMIKVRQPLQRIMIPVLDARDREDIEAIADLIKSEVNVKEIQLLDDASDILVKKIKPNFKVLGPKFGKNMRFVNAEIQKFTQEDITKIETEGKITVKIDNNLITLTLDEVEIASQDIEGWLVANQDNLTVALDITLNDKLKNEGVARELVNRIQNLRKESGFDVTDRIDLCFQKDGHVEFAIAENEKYIKTETLTNNLLCLTSVKEGVDVAFDNINTKLVIKKA